MGGSSCPCSVCSVSRPRGKRQEQEERSKKWKRVKIACEPCCVITSSNQGHGVNGVDEEESIIEEKDGTLRRSC